MKANQDIRELIYTERLKNWQVAEQIGISNSRFSVWLRTPLNEKCRLRVLKAIDELKTNENGGEFGMEKIILQKILKEQQETNRLLASIEAQYGKPKFKAVRTVDENGKKVLKKVSIED